MIISELQRLLPLAFLDKHEVRALHRNIGGRSIQSATKKSSQKYHGPFLCFLFSPRSLIRISPFNALSLSSYSPLQCSMLGAWMAEWPCERGSMSRRRGVSLAGRITSIAGWVTLHPRAMMRIHRNS